MAWDTPGADFVAVDENWNLCQSSMWVSRLSFASEWTVKIELRLALAVDG